MYYHRVNLAVNLNLEQKKEICLVAKKICFKWWVDKLDCSISIYRKLIKMSFKKIMEKLKDNSHFTVIERPAYFPYDKEYVEVGFATMDLGPTYFLWVLVDIDKINQLPHISRQNGV